MEPRNSYLFWFLGRSFLASLIISLGLAAVLPPEPPVSCLVLSVGCASKVLSTTSLKLYFTIDLLVLEVRFAHARDY